MLKMAWTPRRTFAQSDVKRALNNLVAWLRNPPARERLSALSASGLGHEPTPDPSPGRNRAGAGRVR